MALQPQITALAQAVGADIKGLRSGKQDAVVHTTLSAFSALTTSSGLLSGCLYYLTDTKQIAIALTTSTYDLWNRAAEQGFVVSASAPTNPYLNQVWLQIP